MTDSLSRLLRSMTALVLLAGFLVSFVPDWTGLDGHQIVGTALGALAGYHAWLHRSWIGALAKRLWKAPLGRGQWLWLLDAALAGAFAIIIGTGLLISTWVGLPEEALTLWINLHVVGSVTTLALVVVKGPLIGAGSCRRSAHDPSPGWLPQRPFARRGRRDAISWR